MLFAVSSRAAAAAADAAAAFICGYPAAICAAIHQIYLHSSLSGITRPRFIVVAIITRPLLYRRNSRT